MNKVFLAGRIGQDPEIKYTAGGMAVANLSVATNYSKKNANGEWERLTEWTRVNVFGKDAEYLEKYAGKGDRIVIDGTLRTRSWEAQNGEKKYSTEVLANSIELFGQSNKSDGDDAENSRGHADPKPAAKQPGRKTAPEEFNNHFDDDIPF